MLFVLIVVRVAATQYACVCFVVLFVCCDYHGQNDQWFSVLILKGLALGIYDHFFPLTP